MRIACIIAAATVLLPAANAGARTRAHPSASPGNASEGVPERSSEAQQRAPASIERPDESLTLGTRVPDVWFLDEHGDTVTSADFAGVPLIINPVFTGCRHICPAVTSSLVDATKDLGGVGRTFNILVLSFDPADTPETLSAYRERVGIPPAWRMACGTPENPTPFLEALDCRFLPLPGGGCAHHNASLTPT